MYPQRYLDWSVWIVIAVLGVVGAVVFGSVRSRILAAKVLDDESSDDLVETTGGYRAARRSNDARSYVRTKRSPGTCTMPSPIQASRDPAAASLAATHPFRASTLARSTPPGRSRSRIPATIVSGEST